MDYYLWFTDLSDFSRWILCYPRMTTSCNRILNFSRWNPQLDLRATSSFLIYIPLSLTPSLNKGKPIACVNNLIFRGVQLTCQFCQNQLDLTQPVELSRFLGFGGLGWVTIFFFFSNSGSGWVWVIKFQIRQTWPNPPIYLKYII